MNTISKILWDFNGTLANDTALCHEILNGQLRKYKLPEISFEAYRNNFFFPLRGFYSRVGFDLTKIPFEDINHSFLKEYNSRRNECRLNAGVRRTLDKVKSKGIEQSILSAYKTNYLLEMVDFLSIGSYFADVVGLDDTMAAGKIKTGIVYLQNKGWPPTDTVLVGDTVHDFDTAQAMKTQCILFAGGHNSKKLLVPCGIPVIEEIPQVTEYI